MLIRSLTNMSKEGIFRRARLFSRPGKISLRRGQQVLPTDGIGTVCSQASILTLDIQSGLGLPAQKCTEYIQRKAGDKVSAGDVIAITPPGWLRRAVRAPADGLILWVGAGRVLLEAQETFETVPALYPGLVIDLVPEWGVVIETAGRQIQGVWGNGKAAYGRLVLACGSAEEPLEATPLDGTMGGCVIVGGSCNSAESLKKAAALSPAGLILSSMTAKLNTFAGTCDFPILLMEGFGNIPYNDLIIEQLAKLDGRETVIQARKGEGPENPLEVLAPFGLRGEAAYGLQKDVRGANPSATWTPFFYPGQQVRIIQAPYRGKIGMIDHIFSSPQRLSNGLIEPAAKVCLKNREEVIVPLTNLDVVE